MDRRTFLHLAALPAFAAGAGTPSYRSVSSHQGAAGQGMPGKHRGEVVRVHHDQCIDAKTNKVDAAVVQRMVSEGMRALTGASADRDAWASFVTPQDVVGIKVNCSGAPRIRSAPEVVAAIVSNLNAVGVPPDHIYIYERFRDQLQSVHYDRYVPSGVNIVAVEASRGSIYGYDPNTYVDVNFFGEDDTRSNMVRLVTDRLTKIINVPNMKDHQAAGVTGCLKNIAYGNFSNVARSHSREKTNTLSFIGTLAAVEPLRSRTVLNIMDGLAGVWHGGPFADYPQFRFYPKQIMFGTDPVAMDRLLIDIIEEKRKAEGALSIWDRSMTYVRQGEDTNIRVNHFIREPGHIEFASRLGLGEYDKANIKLKSINL